MTPPTSPNLNAQGNAGPRTPRPPVYAQGNVAANPKIENVVTSVPVAPEKPRFGQVQPETTTVHASSSKTNVVTPPTNPNSNAQGNAGPRTRTPSVHAQGNVAANPKKENALTPGLVVPEKPQFGQVQPETTTVHASSSKTNVVTPPTSPKLNAQGNAGLQTPSIHAQGNIAVNPEKENIVTPGPVSTPNQPAERVRSHSPNAPNPNDVAYEPRPERNVPSDKDERLGRDYRPEISAGPVARPNWNAPPAVTLLRNPNVGPVARPKKSLGRSF